MMPVYDILPTSERSSQEDSLLSDSEKDHIVIRSPGSAFRRHLPKIPYFALLLSIISNITLLVLLKHAKRAAPAHLHYDISPFAGLLRNVPKLWRPYDGLTEAEEDKIWNEETNFDKGQIALDYTYAQEMGLPRAQRFPWDEEKGIYLINAYHNLHCVKTLRDAFVDIKAGKTIPAYEHIFHCLHILRDEIRCNADDVPRYTGFQTDNRSGGGQPRMCRDWEQLEAWAANHTACWRYVGNSSAPGYSELERYRFCPEGSPWYEVSKTKKAPEFHNYGHNGFQPLSTIKPVPLNGLEPGWP